MPKQSLESLPESVMSLARSGKSFVEISGGVLDKPEAREWVYGPVDEDGYPIDPVLWLTRNLPGWPKARSAAIARWLLDVYRRGAWGQLTKERHITTHSGDMHYKLIDSLHEVLDDDLVNGPRTNVEKVFESVSDRIGYAGDSRDHRVLNQSGWPLYKKVMRELNTPALLVGEARYMSNCVDSYGNAVKTGQSVILSLNVDGSRSTVELEKVPAGGRPPRVRLHYGPRNMPPAEINKVLLKRWMEKVFTQG